MEALSSHFVLKPKVMHNFCELKGKAWFGDHYIFSLVQYFSDIISWDIRYISWFLNGVPL